MRSSHTFSHTFAAALFTIGLAATTLPQTANAGIVQYQQDFEAHNHGWFAGGVAGFDHGKSYARQGHGNAWVRATSGWNAVHVILPLGGASAAGANCRASAWLRVSPDVTDGYMSIRPQFANGPGEVVNEIKLVGPTPPANNGYKQFVFDFSHPRSDVMFYVGLWGNGRDAWIQVDDVVLECNTPY
jgi:hypothetical protein